MANWIAVQLDRQQVAEMSCIAGIGAGIRSFVRQAREAGILIAIDGCSLQCARQCLAKERLRPDFHYDLSRFGAEKSYHQDFDEAKAAGIMQTIMRDLTQTCTSAT
ncbi:MAG: putative zinc-binding protein [Candidatus Omnitrophica bacterium]|nr:putative zinc-binding protein [Candidatus Omnitrophota bacterium]